MTQTSDPSPPPPTQETDLVAQVHRVLAASCEPLTLSKIRAQLPAALRGISQEELAEVLHRQVAANALHQYPKYRSPQDRFWDRSMPIHIAALIRTALEEGPLVWSELRRKLPAYAQGQAETVLQEQLGQGLLHRHPRAGSRGSERFGTQPPNPKEYLQGELSSVFQRLQRLGFGPVRIRAAALELLHDEAWAPTPEPEPEPRSSAVEQTPAESPDAPMESPPHESRSAGTNRPDDDPMTP